MVGQVKSFMLHALLGLFFLISLSSPYEDIETFYGQCGLAIDLVMDKTTQSGLLVMPLPKSMTRYQDPTHPVYCDIMINFGSDTQLLIELYFLDIMPLSADIKTCTTGLEIFDQTGRKYYGSRICMEGWQWEERHREKQYEKHLVENSPLTFRLISEGPYRGQGFKLHFNQIRRHLPCFIQEFKCQQIQRCVHNGLTCDGWDDCGDYSDEREDAGCDLMTASEICALIIGLLLLTGFLTETVAFIMTYRRLSHEYGTKTGRSMVVSVVHKHGPETSSAAQYHNSFDSLASRNSKSNVATKHRKEFESDKEDVEKANRHSRTALDETSKSSLHSNSRQIRANSHGTDALSEPAAKSSLGHKNHSSSLSSLHHDKREPVSGIDNPALEMEKGSAEGRGRHSGRDSHYVKRGRPHDHYNDSSDDTYDETQHYKNRRRRSSRERSKEHDSRRNIRYSNGDSDYDRERRKGSHQRYNDDSDYDRERRKGSYQRYSDDSDSERRQSRDRYRQDKYDSDSKTGNNRDRNDNKPSYHDRQKDTSDKDQKWRSHSEDDSDDKPDQVRKSHDKRQSLNAEKYSYTPSQNVKKKSNDHGNHKQQEKHQDPSAFPLPPPFLEDDTQRMEEPSHKLPKPDKEFNHTNQQVSTKNLANPEEEVVKPSVKEETEARRYSRSRWTQQNTLISNSKSTSGGIIYREESL